MGVQRVAAADAIERLDDYGAILDARSESEYADDHLPGARNWPSLTDAERTAIGTEYAQASPFEARKRGAVLTLRNVAAHLEREALGLARDWRPLVYCWRGGQRSGALATVLGAIGFDVQVLDGGYRAFRRVVLDELDIRPARFEFRVLCGRTGSGKSRLLGALADTGAQVLDLEALAKHRGSVLGPLPGQPQPSQKAFETAVWHALRGFDPAHPVWAESESRTIGRLRVPEALLLRLRSAACVAIEMPLAARVELLMQDYGHFVQDAHTFCARLDALRELRGAALIDRWQAQARSGEFAAVVRELLAQHYDPTYERSMARNYTGFAQAETLALADGAATTLAAAARRLSAHVQAAVAGEVRPGGEA